MCLCNFKGFFSALIDKALSLPPEIRHGMAQALRSHAYSLFLRRISDTMKLPMSLTCLRHSLLGLMLAGTIAQAAGVPPREDMAAFSQRAEQWLLEAIKTAGKASSSADSDVAVSVQAGRLDARTQLSKCQQAIDIDFAPGQGLRAKTNLSLTCPDTPGWRLFLPMTITRRATVWVARNSIARGSALQAAQWQREMRDVASLPASAITSADLTGYQASMTIAAGAVLTQALVSGKTVVKRGQSLDLLASQGSIAISTRVEAQENGAIGQRIQVKNVSSGRVIEAEVINAEQVQVILAPAS